MPQRRKCKESILLHIFAIVCKIQKSLFGLVFLFFLIIVDLEVPELVGVLGVGNDAEPVPEVVLLQVLLGQVLEVPLAEWDG